MAHPRPIEIVERAVLPVGKVQRRWAELLRRVYEVAPLTCPACGGAMRIFAFITAGAVIDRILAHLRRAPEAARGPPPDRLPDGAARYPRLALIPPPPAPPGAFAMPVGRGDARAGRCTRPGCPTPAVAILATGRDTAEPGLAARLQRSPVGSYGD